MASRSRWLVGSSSSSRSDEAHQRLRQVQAHAPAARKLVSGSRICSCVAQAGQQLLGARVRGGASASASGVDLGHAGRSRRFPARLPARPARPPAGAARRVVMAYSMAGRSSAAFPGPRAPCARCRVVQVALVGGTPRSSANRLDLPAPLAPMRPILSPGLSSRSAVEQRPTPRAKVGSGSWSKRKRGPARYRRARHGARGGMKGVGFRPGVQAARARERHGAGPGAAQQRGVVRVRNRIVPGRRGNAVAGLARGGMDEGARARSGGGDGSGQRQHAFGFARVQVFHQRTVDRPWPLAWASRQRLNRLRATAISPGCWQQAALAAAISRMNQRLAVEALVAALLSQASARPASSSRSGARHPTPPVRGRGRP